MIQQATGGAAGLINNEFRGPEPVRHSAGNKKHRAKMVGIDGSGQQACIHLVGLKQKNYGHPTTLGMP